MAQQQRTHPRHQDASKLEHRRLLHRWPKAAFQARKYKYRGSEHGGDAIFRRRFLCRSRHGARAAFVYRAGKEIRPQAICQQRCPEPHPRRTRQPSSPSARGTDERRRDWLCCQDHALSISNRRHTLRFRRRPKPYCRRNGPRQDSPGHRHCRIAQGTQHGIVGPYRMPYIAQIPVETRNRAFHRQRRYSR